MSKAKRPKGEKAKRRKGEKAKRIKGEKASKEKRLLKMPQHSMANVLLDHEMSPENLAGHAGCVARRFPIQDLPLLNDENECERLKMLQHSIKLLIHYLKFEDVPVPYVKKYVSC